MILKFVKREKGLLIPSFSYSEIFEVILRLKLYSDTPGKGPLCRSFLSTRKKIHSSNGEHLVFWFVVCDLETGCHIFIAILYLSATKG